MSKNKQLISVEDDEIEEIESDDDPEEGFVDYLSGILQECPEDIIVEEEGWNNLSEWLKMASNTSSFTSIQVAGKEIKETGHTYLNENADFEDDA